MQDGRTLLWYTVNFGSKEVVKVLLNHGANVDSPGKVLLPPCPPISTALAERRLFWLESHGDATRVCGGVGEVRYARLLVR